MYRDKFEHLARQARYHLDNSQTLDLFTQGLPDVLYMKIYKLDDPQDYEQWKQGALNQQCQFIHVKACLNCYKPVPMPYPSTNWGPHPNSGQPCFNIHDPNAMDTSPGRVHTQLNTTSPIVPALGGPAPTWGLPTPWGGGRGNRFDIRTVTCYHCRQKRSLQPRLSTANLEPFGSPSMSWFPEERWEHLRKQLAQQCKDDPSWRRQQYWILWC